jgi:FixJ family two-component response regulator
MKHLSYQRRQDVISRLKSGDTAREVSRKLGIHHKTVDKIRDKYCPMLIKSRGGRSPRLNTVETRNLARDVALGVY